MLKVSPKSDRPLPAAAEPDDSELLSRWQGGDRSAFVLLVRRWETAVYRVAHRVTADRTEAEDVTQTVFLRLIEEPWRIRCPDRLGPWLLRSAVNASINQVRRRRRFRQLEEDLARSAKGGVRPPSQALPERQLVEREEAEELRQALLQLAPADRALLALRFDEELTFREISTVVRKPIGTVKSQIQRAVSKLRARIVSIRPEETHGMKE